jgi:hypothetical protein
MDSTANPKVKIAERKGVATCSLVHSTSGVEGRAGALKWTRKIEKHFTYSHKPT